jgi:phenylacetic acid degradation operon negative regulatory protein
MARGTERGPVPAGEDTVALSLSRRHDAGAESARGLLFTVLGELVLPTGEAAWTSSFIDVLGRLGVEEKACRQALMRTAADGWLSSQRSGRRTRWRLTADAERLLTEGAARIYGFTATAAQWDGRFLMVLARVPERDRAARHLLRTRLGWAGLGSPTPGVWIGAHTGRLAQVEDVLRQAGLFEEARVFVAEHGGGGPLEGLVRQAWDLDTLDAAYRAFLDGFASPDPAGDPLARLIDLVHAWRRFPWLDPTLPRELLPAAWHGEDAAALFAARRAAWSPAALETWARLEA